MTPEEYSIKEKNNKALERAAAEGDLEQVIFLTTSEKKEDLADINCGHNYPLRAACLYGHLEVIKFLLNHPDTKKRNSLNTFDAFRSALSVALDDGQNKVIKFLKSHSQQYFARYMAPANLRTIDTHFDRLTMRGSLSTIKLLMKEMSPAISVSYVPMLLGKALQYKHNTVFEYWLKYAKKDLFIQKETNESINKEAADLVHTALYCKKIKELKRLVDHFNLNLSELIGTNTFRIIIELSPKTLTDIVQELDYKPNDKLKAQILENFKELSPTDTYYQSFSDFINVLQIKEEKEKLESSIAPVSSIATNEQVGLKVDKKADRKILKV